MSKNLLNRNLIANTLNQVLGVGFPVLIQSYIIRILNLEDIGYWNIILSAKSIILLYVSFFSIYLVKSVAEVVSFKRTQFIITNSIVAIGITAVLPIILYNIYLISKYPQFLELILVSSIPLVTFPISIDYLYQGKLRNDFIFYRRIVVKLVFIGLLFTIVKDSTHFLYFVYLSSLILSAEHFINLFYGRKYIKIKYIHSSYIKEIIKGSVPYFPFLVTFNILPHLSIVIGDYLYSTEEIGIYSILFKLINLATTFVSSTAMVFLPLKLKNLSEKKGFSDSKYLIGTVIASLCVIIGLVIGKDIIFYLFLADYTVSSMNINYYLLTLYVPIHSTYNYIIFNSYFANNKVLISTIFNLIIIFSYCLIFYISKLYILEILFATNVIISASMGLVALLIFHKAKKYVWTSRLL